MSYSDTLSDDVGEPSISSSGTNSRVNCVDDDFERLELATQTADADGRSWAAHSQAQIQVFGSEKYYDFYKQFVELRTVVESNQFSIHPKFGYMIARWLGKAAQFHDVAEHAFDNGNVQEAQSGWSNVGRSLETRYLLLNFSLALRDKSIDELSELIDKINRTEVPDEVHVIVQDILGFQYYEEIMHLAKHQSSFELGQWETHHRKDYDGFNSFTVKLLESLGYSNSTAIRAAAHLANSCQHHDRAEDIRDNHSDDSELVMQISSLWNSANENLIKYYDILLSCSE